MRVRSTLRTKWLRRENMMRIFVKIYLKKCVTFISSEYRGDVFKAYSLMLNKMQNAFWTAWQRELSRDNDNSQIISKVYIVIESKWKGLFLTLNILNINSGNNISISEIRSTILCCVYYETDISFWKNRFSAFNPSLSNRGLAVAEKQ